MGSSPTILLELDDTQAPIDPLEYSHCLNLLQLHVAHASGTEYVKHARTGVITSPFVAINVYDFLGPGISLSQDHNLAKRN